jgi:hypothetical protein
MRYVFVVENSAEVVRFFWLVVLVNDKWEKQVAQEKAAVKIPYIVSYKLVELSTV